MKSRAQSKYKIGDVDRPEIKKNFKKISLYIIHISYIRKKASLIRPKIKIDCLNLTKKKKSKYVSWHVQNFKSFDSTWKLTKRAVLPYFNLLNKYLYDDFIIWKFCRYISNIMKAWQKAFLILHFPSFCFLFCIFFISCLTHFLPSKIFPYSLYVIFLTTFLLIPLSFPSQTPLFF